MKEVVEKDAKPHDFETCVTGMSAVPVVPCCRKQGEDYHNDFQTSDRRGNKKKNQKI